MALVGIDEAMKNAMKLIKGAEGMENENSSASYGYMYVKYIKDLFFKTIMSRTEGRQTYLQRLLEHSNIKTTMIY